MKTFKTSMIIFIIIGIGIIIGSLINGVANSLTNNSIRIELNSDFITIDKLKIKNIKTIVIPKEYSLISTNSNKPDTLITWISKDTINLRFLVAARNYPKENH